MKPWFLPYVFGVLLEASLKRARIQPLVSARTILMFDDCCCRFSRPRKGKGGLGSLFFEATYHNILAQSEMRLACMSVLGLA